MASSVDGHDLEAHDDEPQGEVDRRDDERRGPADPGRPADDDPPDEQLHQAHDEGQRDRGVDRIEARVAKDEDGDRGDRSGEDRRLVPDDLPDARQG